MCKVGHGTRGPSRGGRGSRLLEVGKVPLHGMSMRVGAFRGAPGAHHRVEPALRRLGPGLFDPLEPGRHTLRVESLDTQPALSTVPNPKVQVRMQVHSLLVSSPLSFSSLFFASLLSSPAEPSRSTHESGGCFYLLLNHELRQGSFVWLRPLELQRPALLHVLHRGDLRVLDGRTRVRLQLQ